MKSLRGLGEGSVCKAKRASQTKTCKFKELRGETGASFLDKKREEPL